MIQNFYLHACGESAEIGYIASHKVHRLLTSGIQFRKAFGNFGVTLSIPQPAGNIRFILPGKQAGTHHLPQILIHFFRVRIKVLCNRTVSQVIFQKLLKPFQPLSPEDGVSHTGRQKLYRILPQFCNLIFLIFQIDNTSFPIDRCCGIINFFPGDSLLDGLIFLLGYGNIDLMNRSAVSDSDCVSFTDDGLAEQIRHRRIWFCFRTHICCTVLHSLSIHGLTRSKLKGLLFLQGIESPLLNQLGDPALYLGPGHITRRPICRHREGRQIITIFLT